MKSNVFRFLVLAGLALLLGGCANLRRQPAWICGNGIILDEAPPAPSPAAAAPTGK